MSFKDGRFCDLGSKRINTHIKQALITDKAIVNSYSHLRCNITVGSNIVSQHRLLVSIFLKILHRIVPCLLTNLQKNEVNKGQIFY